MRFDPHSDEDLINGDTLNLWEGFGVAARRPEGRSGASGCQRFLDHCRKVICSGNEEHYDYLIKREALIVQIVLGTALARFLSAALYLLATSQGVRRFAFGWPFDRCQRLAGITAPDGLGALVIAELALAAELDPVGHGALAAITSASRIRSRSKSAMAANNVERSRLDCWRYPIADRRATGMRRRPCRYAQSTPAIRASSGQLLVNCKLRPAHSAGRA